MKRIQHLILRQHQLPPKQHQLPHPQPNQIPTPLLPPLLPNPPPRVQLRPEPPHTLHVSLHRILHSSLHLGPHTHPGILSLEQHSGTSEGKPRRLAAPLHHVTDQVNRYVLGVDVPAGRGREAVADKGQLAGAVPRREGCRGENEKDIDVRGCGLETVWGKGEGVKTEVS